MEDFVIKMKAARAEFINQIRQFAQDAGADLTGDLSVEVIQANADKIATLMIDLQNLNLLIRKYDK